MKHRQFIRNAAFFLALALAFPMGFLSAGVDVGDQTFGTTPKQDNDKKEINSSEQWSFLPDVVASYGDKKISKQDFIKEISNAMKMMGGNKIPEEQLKKIAPRMIERMVEKAILLNLAEKAGIQPSPELVTGEFEKMYKEMPEQQKTMLKANLKQKGTTLEEYKSKIGSNVQAQEGIAIEKYLKENVLDKIKVSDDDVKKFYKEKEKMFQTPESVTASHILIAPEDKSDEAKAKAKAKAEKILAELRKNPERFGTLAEENSACPSGKKAQGSLGKFRRGQMVPEFDKVAFSIEPNKISDLVETKYGYHIIKVTDKQAAGTVPFEKVKDYIKDQLTGEKSQKVLKEFIDKEKEKMNIKINV